jgi:hypothetical protein
VAARAAGARGHDRAASDQGCEDARARKRQHVGADAQAQGQGQYAVLAAQHEGQQRGQRHVEVARELVGPFERPRNARKGLAMKYQRRRCAGPLLRQREHRNQRRTRSQGVRGNAFVGIRGIGHGGAAERGEILECLGALAQRRREIVGLRRGEHRCDQDRRRAE